MSSFNVEIQGLDKLERALKDYPKIAEPIYQKAILASAAEVFKPSQQAGIVPFKTGFLRKSFGIVTGRLFAKISPGTVYPVKYAKWVNDGTDPHVIRPRLKKALFWKGAAHPVKGVQHPGTKPREYIQKIIQIAQPNVNMHFQRALDLIAEAIAKS